MDGKTVLDPTDDAANVNLGGSWRIPTAEEWEELRHNCEFSSASAKGIDGLLCTSTVDGYTDRYIILPFTRMYKDF